MTDFARELSLFFEEKIRTALVALVYAAAELIPIILTVSLGAALVNILYRLVALEKGNEDNDLEVRIGSYLFSFIAMLGAYLHQLGNDRIISQAVPAVSLMMIVAFRLLAKARIIHSKPPGAGATVVATISGTLSFLLSARYFEKLFT